jgi:uncharacterized membrane protein YhhN
MYIPLFWTLFIPATACAILYLAMTARSASLVRTLTKTLSVALLAVLAAVSDAPILLVIALALCAAGDALLSAETEQTFVGGIASFAAGHIAYILLFLTHTHSDLSLLSHHILSVGALAALGVFMAVVLAPRAGDLRLPVLMYIPIILGMGVAALCLPATGMLIWVWPAAVAFIASDLTLATEKFLLPKSHPALRFTPYLIWPLYWGAQLGFLVAFT